MPAWIAEIANNLYWYGLGFLLGGLIVPTVQQGTAYRLEKEYQELRGILISVLIVRKKIEIVETNIQNARRIEEIKRTAKWN